MAHFILGIDNGGSVSKTALYSTEGKLIAQASESVPSVISSPGWSERDMNGLWTANVNAISRVIQGSGVHAKDIIGVTVTGHGNGLYMIDADGRPVRNGIVSNDFRTKSIVADWKRVGNYRTFCRDQVMQPLLTGGPIPLMYWLWHNEPENVKKTKYVLFIKDYIRFKLTGLATLEFTDTSTTDLLDMQSKIINVQAFQNMGVGPWEEKIPQIIGSDDIGGEVTPGAAAETGLAPGTPVYGGTADMNASLIGAGGFHDYQLTMVTGTWSINGFFSTKLLSGGDLDLIETGTIAAYAPIPGRYLIVDASPTSAANLEWFVRSVLRQLPGMTDMNAQEIYEFCEHLAFAEGISSAGTKYLPFIYGSGLHPDCLAGWTGLSNVDGIAQLLRSLYEGVAFATREHVERLNGYAKLGKTARLTGGVANSQCWVQVFADALGIPIETVDVKETGILGVIMVALTGLGYFKDLAEATDAMVPRCQTIEPNTGTRAVYEAKYHEWLFECTLRRRTMAHDNGFARAVRSVSAQ